MSRWHRLQRENQIVFCVQYDKARSIDLVMDAPEQVMFLGGVGHGNVEETKSVMILRRELACLFRKSSATTIPPGQTTGDT
jgi:hypothetical protein